MQKRKLGLSGIEVSAVGLGCNNFGGRTDMAGTRAVVHRALDLGVTLFDTADVYGNRGRSEEYLGEILGARRNDIVLATKFGMPMSNSAKSRDASPAYIKRAVEASLRRLRTDWIDLYQVHRSDPSTPIEDTLGALDELVKAGKVREIGCSQFSAEQLREAERAVPAGAARFVAVQNEYSLLHRQPERDDVLAECDRLGLGFVPFFPLASGMLTGKYRRGRPIPSGSRISEGGGYAELLNERNLEIIEELVRFAESRGHTLLELAFSWLLARPVVTSVIAGATKPEQVRANAAAARWRLTDAELAEVDAAAAVLEGRAA